MSAGIRLLVVALFIAYRMHAPSQIGIVETSRFPMTSTNAS
jgi:hypothetical protein